MEYYMEILFKLVAAVILGGLIGYERESSHRPAGFRTHILVCVGATLVMITSEFVYTKYFTTTNLDPARLGAQVISGIGFLGAGTIIKEGVNVRGLTTAASLWAVACVGLAVGIGFFEAAFLASLLIFIALILLKKLEYRFSAKYKTIFVVLRDDLLSTGKLIDILGEHNAKIKNVDFINEDESQEEILLKLIVRTGAKFDWKQLRNALYALDSIYKVYM